MQRIYVASIGLGNKWGVVGRPDSVLDDQSGMVVLVVVPQSQPVRNPVTHIPQSGSFDQW